MQNYKIDFTMIFAIYLRRNRFVFSITYLTANFPSMISTSNTLITSIIFSISTTFHS